MEAESACHLYCTACRLVLVSHFNITKLFNDHILFLCLVYIGDVYKFRFPRGWVWKQIFFLSDFLLYHYSDFWYYRSLLYYGKLKKMSDLKLLHARRIVEMYDYLKHQATKNFKYIYLYFSYILSYDCSLLFIICLCDFNWNYHKFLQRHQVLKL